MVLYNFMKFLTVPVTGGDTEKPQNCENWGEVISCPPIFLTYF